MSCVIIWQLRCGAIIQCLAELVYIVFNTYSPFIPGNINKAHGTDMGVTVAIVCQLCSCLFADSLKNWSAIKVVLSLFLCLYLCKFTKEISEEMEFEQLCVSKTVCVEALLEKERKREENGEKKRGIELQLTQTLLFHELGCLWLLLLKCLLLESGYYRRSCA